MDADDCEYYGLLAEHGVKLSHQTNDECEELMKMLFYPPLGKDSDEKSSDDEDSFDDGKLTKKELVGFEVLPSSAENDQESSYEK